MKKYRIMAAIFAVLTGIFIFLFLNSVRGASRGSYVDVVVASRQIGGQTTLNADMLEIRQIPAEAVLPDAARQIKSAEGLVTEQGLEKGEVVLVSKLLKAGSHAGGLSGRIPAGARAVTIQVDTYAGVGGSLKAGDNVDVLAEMDIMSQKSAEKEPTSILLLENIAVLATGTETSSGTAGGAKSAYGSVTLAVTPEQSLKLNLAAVSGKIRLSLRPPADASVPTPAPVTPDDLAQGVK